MTILAETCHLLARTYDCPRPMCSVSFRWAFLDEGTLVPYAIAIPAQDEQNRIVPCLQGCLEAMRHEGRLGRVILVVNNTGDQTAAIASQWAIENGLPIEIITADLPPALAHAGAARRLAMDRARTFLSHGGILLTTDADSVPERTWITENLKEIADCSGLICGRVEFDKDEVAQLPPGTLETGTSETLYKRISWELDSLIDPDPINPWPHHGQVSGASLALRASAYDQVGGMPLAPCGEDRALARAFRENGLSVRHSDRPGVMTSCRLVGRAVGGMAETIALRMAQDNYLCDEGLERADQTRARALSRRRIRKALGRTVSLKKALADLSLSDEAIDRALNISSFGPLWSLLEKESPLLARKAMLRREMEAETPRLIELRDRQRSTAHTRVAAGTVDVE